MTDLVTRILNPDTIWAHVGALLCAAFAACDLWHFHSLSQETSLVLLTAALGAFGVTTAAAWPTPKP